MTREVWGISEIAAGLKVSESLANRWTKDPRFPKPQTLKMGRVWEADAVREWRRQDVAARRQRRAF